MSVSLTCPTSLFMVSVRQFLLKKKILLTIGVIKKENLLVNNDVIAKTFDKHFAETLEILYTFEWLSNKKDLLNDQLTAIIIKFQNHPSIMKIKSKYKF